MNHCNLEGASLLKERIEEYWRERGADVRVRIEEAGYLSVMRTARVDVRSDMLNGWPREWVEK